MFNLYLPVVVFLRPYMCEIYIDQIHSHPSLKPCLGSPNRFARLREPCGSLRTGRSAADWHQGRWEGKGGRGAGWLGGPLPFGGLGTGTAQHMERHVHAVQSEACIAGCIVEGVLSLVYRMSCLA